MLSNVPRAGDMGQNWVLLKYACRCLHLYSFITEINSVQEQCSNCHPIGLLPSEDAKPEMRNYWRARELFKVQQLTPECLTVQGTIGANQMQLLYRVIR